MPPCIDELRHDVVALHRFIDSIASDCEQRDDYPTYVAASKDFFDYIHSVGAATKSYLAKFVNDIDPVLATTDPQDFYSQAQVIRTIRTIWFELHQLVKPALDADTLHVPYALVNALTARLRKILNFERVRFAVLHTTKLNYFQIGASNVRDFAAHIASIVPGAPPFPDNLGIIALLYSQSSSVFLNLALAHEMGHFAFQERAEAARLSPSIVAAVQAAATGIQLQPLDLVWSKDRVLAWCEEIYCDLFALWLIGPSFSFSFIELFAYSRLAPTISAAGTTLPSIASEASFSDSHPAAAFRLGAHVRFLKSRDVGWWDKIKGGSSPYITLLADAEGLDQTLFTFVSQYRPGLSAVALAAFFKVVSNVPDTVRNAFVGVSTDVDSFETQQKAIEEYLSFGVVPSRLVSGDEAALPSTVALVNSANLFYLERLDVLIARFRGAKTDCVECRALWAERLEMWTSKALEDIDT